MRSCQCTQELSRSEQREAGIVELYPKPLVMPASRCSLSASRYSMPASRFEHRAGLDLGLLDAASPAVAAPAPFPLQGQGRGVSPSVISTTDGRSTRLAEI